MSEVISNRPTKFETVVSFNVELRIPAHYTRRDAIANIRFLFDGNSEFAETLETALGGGVELLISVDGIDVRDGDGRLRD